MKRSFFPMVTNSFARLSQRKAKRLIERGAEVVGYVAMLPDGRRVTADQGVVVYHAHQITGPAKQVPEVPAGPPGQDAGQPPAMPSNGLPMAPQAAGEADHFPCYDHQHGDLSTVAPATFSPSRTLPASAEPVGVILQTEDGARCVIDSGLVTWHDEAITRPLTTRLDAP